ncbi:hypothetical protein GUITHDRAFT_155355 [Guillardia theta CCMP2712]|uniref:Uncharacterized protein n=1 Tax=Guillardia theta (strain CCMP2712) TaxID=905079 RepID=L1IIB8_GUITC|nr:hypothetical protein GUITHDRAFT_155355 [Guillardia theta CCMP2712]EKX35971.1 hypothetical protein GUITHDRAFT_155355 [Guillardia theta CCMP2712]|eukprot:XP_005822951.1 hypothetical protein GUITHDRAFT_155355 [Guillardia theta CCMP2712]
MFAPLLRSQQLLTVCCAVFHPFKQRFQLSAISAGRAKARLGWPGDERAAVEMVTAQDGDLLSFTRITWNALRDAKELKTIEDPVSLP